MTVWQRLSKTSCARTRSRVARQAICKANLPRGGTVFVFRSKRADRMKLLYWDGTGLVMAYKRLEEHTFTWPAIKDGLMALNHARFEALFSGLDWRKVRAFSVRPPTAAE
ncbi:IS66 family insertion sequence element accessory protein TnpB [Pseudorhodobacter turbinis]|uniref:IS66 family insertion sequence element accessory protein TnpB n=1 Tax=Pseudorhodobacter turbinis TaxID=2500533 RepID=UPI0023F173C4|nr:IS66 family insertion sequence element accessory protein TnpB [Pseudorhodobacter turbinis]